MADSAERIKFRHSCGKKISCPARLAGKYVRCPRCGQPAAVPAEVADHTRDERPAALADDQRCQLRRHGQGAVVETTVGRLKADAAAGALSGDDMIRLRDTGEWIPLSELPEVAAHIQSAPSRVGGFRFDSSEPETQDDAMTETDARAMCERHPDRPAEYVCSQCRKPLCPECRNRLEGQVYCETCSDRLIAELREQLKAALPSEATPAEALQSVEATALPEERRDASSETGVAQTLAFSLNRAIHLELGAAFLLSWLGVGWMYMGRMKTGIRLLAANFGLVILELTAVLANRERLPSFADGLWWVIPCLLIQNLALGAASALRLRRRMLGVE